MRILAVLLLTLLLACNTSSFASQAPCNSGVSLETPTSQEQELAALVNQERTKAGRQPLRLDARLFPAWPVNMRKTWPHEIFRIMTRKEILLLTAFTKETSPIAQRRKIYLKAGAIQKKESMKIAHSFLMQSPGHRHGIS